MVEQPIKKVQVPCQICYVNQCLFHYWNQDNSENIIPQNALFIVSFSFLCQWHSLIFGHRCETFHVSWLHIPLHLFNIGYNSTVWTSSSCSVHQIGPWIFVIRHRDQVSEPEPAAIWSNNRLEVFIDLSLLTGSIEFRSSDGYAPSPSLTGGTVFGERERGGEEKEGCLNCVGTYLPVTVLQECRLF